MQERERPCSHVRAELASVERQASLRHDTGDVERALAAMREALTDWQGMPRRETGTISPVIAETAGLQRVWWPQRDSNPCSRTAARFCQLINNLRRNGRRRSGGDGNPELVDLETVY